MVRPGNAIQTFQPILPYRQLGSPFIRLTGDEFCSTAESSLYLLENTSSAIGGTALTNNGSTTFALDTAYGNTVATLNGSSQYFSLPTESSVQVGTGSFIMSIWFKTSTTGVFQMMCTYGRNAASHVNILLYLTSGNKLTFSLADVAGNSYAITDPIAGRWNDGNWHFVAGVLDKTNNIAYLVCDGLFIGSTAIGTLNTLTEAGDFLVIGADFNASNGPENYFNGSLANFHLIKAADYNAIGVLNTGIREPVYKGTGTTLITNDSNTRLNNKFSMTTINEIGDYSYALINVEAGIYEIQQAYIQDSTSGNFQLRIDEKTISTINGNGSTTYNNIVKTYGINLTEGQHLVKIISTDVGAGKGQVYHQFINIIKRKGYEEGGTDNFLLLGDELVERSNNPISLTADGNTYYNSILIQTSSPANGDYTEGTLFVKGGLYRIDVDSTQFTDGGMVDMWIGNVQVLSQLDQYNGVVLHNTVTTKNVRLNQGKQVLRLAINSKNGSSSSYKFYINNIRALRLSD